jgi:primosomal protein N' (replication factor Y)
LFQAIAALDRDQFYALELHARQRMTMPPFGRLTALVVSSPQEALAQRAAQTLATAFPITEGYRLLGPAPAPLKKLRDDYRYRLLVISQQAPHKLLQEWLKNTPLPKNVSVRVDIDPQSFL